MCANRHDHVGMTPQTDAPPLLHKTEKTSEIPPILISKKTAATALSICVRSIDNLLKSKQLPCRRIGRRTLIPYGALVAFARRDHIGTPEANAKAEANKKATDFPSAAQAEVRRDHATLRN